jgi:hypothetical protein
MLHLQNLKSFWVDLYIPMVILYQKSFLMFVSSLEGVFKTCIMLLHYRTCIFYVSNRVTGFHVQNRQHFLMNFIRQPSCKNMKGRNLSFCTKYKHKFMLLHVVTRCVLLKLSFLSPELESKDIEWEGFNGLFAVLV